MELACLHRRKTQGRYFKVREKSAITVVLFTLFPLDMSGRGHRKLRLCSRKNYERKKFKKRSIPPSICSSLKVSMPFLLLPPQSLTVSLPVSLFHDAPLSTFESLKARVECAGVIPCILSMCIERKHLYVNGGAITNRHSLLDPYNYV